MSADNGIYIAKFPDGYRVAYAMGIDNIDYYPMGSKKRKKELKRYFGNSPVFEQKENAEKYAFEIYHDMERDEIEHGMFGYFVLEYGVCHIGEYEAFV
jgi:hypothetical protein